MSVCDHGQDIRQCPGLKVVSLLFADDVVLLVSSHCDLQHLLGQFVVECEAVRMRVGTSQSESTVLWLGASCCPK